jgi:hypothetical protein
LHHIPPSQKFHTKTLIYCQINEYNGLYNINDCLEITLPTLPAATINKIEQGAVAVASPESVEKLEQAFKIPNNNSNLQNLTNITHLERSLAQPSATNAAQNVVNQINPSSISSTAVGVADNIAQVPQGAMGVISAGMLPSMVVGTVAMIPDKIGSFVGSAVGGIGNLFKNNAIQNVGQNIKEAGFRIGNPFHVVAETFNAPQRHFSDIPIAEGHHTISKGIKHLWQQSVNLDYDSKLARDFSGNGVLQKNIITGIEKNGNLKIATQSIPLKDSELLVSGWQQKTRDFLWNAGEKVEKIENQVGEKFGNGIKTVFGENNANKIKDFAEKETFYRGAMKVSAVASSVAQDVKIAHTFDEAYKKLESLYKTVKGIAAEEKVKVTDVLFDRDVPEIYNQARGEILGKAPLAAILAVANNVVSWKTASNDHMQGMKGLAVIAGIQLATSKALGAVMPNSPILELHDVASQIYAQNGKLPPELIDDIISTATPSFRGRINEIKRQVLAAHYNELGLSPAQLLKEITSGQIAATAFDILEKRNRAMEEHDLTDYDTNRPMQRLGKDSPIAVPVNHIYSYTMIKNAGDDLPSLKEAVAEFIIESQPSFREGGINCDKLDAVAFNVAEQIIEKQITPQTVVNKSSVGMVLEALKHIQKIPETDVTKAMLQGKAIAANAPAKVGAMI